MYCKLSLLACSPYLQSLKTSYRNSPSLKDVSENPQVHESHVSVELRGEAAVDLHDDSPDPVKSRAGSVSDIKPNVADGSVVSSFPSLSSAKTSTSGFSESPPNFDRHSQSSTPSSAEMREQSAGIVKVQYVPALAIFSPSLPPLLPPQSPVSILDGKYTCSRCPRRFPTSRKAQLVSSSTITRSSLTAQVDT